MEKGKPDRNQKVKREKSVAERKKVLVVGAGAAGLMAACAASDGGAQVVVLEHNEKAGKKIYITGKGRCNYTNACETEDFFRNVLRNPKFLYSAVYGFDSSAVTEFLEENGCATKEERGKRCFPASDHSFDVTDALVRHLNRKHVKIRFHADVTQILTRENPKLEGDSEMPLSNSSIGAVAFGKTAFDAAGHKDEKAARMACGVRLRSGEEITADAVIVAAGGMSYPSTGSTGDGYRLAKQLGLDVKEPAPSLVPFTVAQSWPLELQGLSLKNVAVRLENLEKNGGSGRKKKRRPVYEGFGEMLFTHFGVSGPLILSASCHADFQAHPEGYLLHLDLKPALSVEELVRRLEREFSLQPRRELRNALKGLLPERLAQIAAQLFAAGLPNPSAEGGADRAVYTLNEKELRELALFLKDLVMTVTGTRGFAEAIVTRGGVSVREINPSTMETRKLKGLYWAGEVLDVDAYTGGFNLQIAWSTGHLAGECAAQ